MKGNRMSAIPVAEFCGRAAGLSNGAGRSAAVSSAFHAVCSGSPHAKALLASLTADEQGQARAMKRPTDVEVAGHVLRYDDAEKETELGLTTRLTYCKADDPELLTLGHEDLGWTVEVNGHRVAYTGDIKRTSWTTLDGPESLQLIAYGLARAARDRCSHMCCGIWDATLGEWHWGELVDLDSEEAVTLGERVIHAAKNTGGDFATGAHCRSCWSRFQCPAHLLGTAFTGSVFDAMTKADPAEDEVRELLLAVQAQEDGIEKAKEFCKAWAEAHGGIRDPQARKVYLPIMCKGRESIDANKVLAEVPNPERFFRQGKPYSMFRWVKG